MESPQTEAMQIFGEVVRDLSATRDYDLKLTLRRCLFACQLLGWHDKATWFQQELSGYLAETDLPTYRLVAGNLVWQSSGVPLGRSSMLRRFDWAMTTDREGGAELVVMQVRGDIEWLVQASKSGHIESTGETKQSESNSSTLERVKVFEAATFSRVVEQIEQLLFEFASSNYALLKYGNVLTDFWTNYRRQVDATMQTLNFGNHLETIQSGLRSDNPEQWRAATFACRNLLNDVANHLWRDPRQEYRHLTVERDGQTRNMSVSQGRFSNRLSAYLHQKGLRGKSGKFFRDELERLATSIRSLIAFQSEAHEPITRQDAQSVALATYFILGEMIMQTDMQPIHEYGEPAAAMAPSTDGEV